MDVSLSRKDLNATVEDNRQNMAQMALPYLQLLRTNATAEVQEASGYLVRMQFLDFVVRPRVDCPTLGFERQPEAENYLVLQDMAFVLQADVLSMHSSRETRTRKGPCVWRSVYRPGGLRRTSPAEPCIVGSHF